MLTKEGTVDETSQKVRELITTLCETEGSQTRFAKRIGATPQKVNNWINGRNGPDKGSIIAISQVYGIPVESILGEQVIEYDFISTPEPFDSDISEIRACFKRMSDKQRRAMVNVAKAMVE